MSDLQTDWNLKLLFDSDDDPSIQKELENTIHATEEFSKKWSSRDDYLKDAATLKEAIEDYEKYLHDHKDGGVASYYWWLRKQLNQSDSKVKAEWGKIKELEAKLSNQLQFFELNLGKISQEKQAEFLSSPELKQYKHFLERVFEEAKYQLSQDKEEVLNLKSNTSYELWVDMVSELLSEEARTVIQEDGSEQKVNFESLLGLMSSNDKKVRDEAAKAFHEINATHSEVATHELNAIFANKKVDDNLRGFERPDTQRHLADDISTATVDTLVDAVTRHNDISKRYYELKAKLLNVDYIEYHERNVEYGSVNIEYPYEKAVELVRSVFSNLDTEFQQIFSRFIDNGNIDVYPKTGKRGGAFCVYWGKAHPSYVFLNYVDKLRDVTTLAHEVGHGIHFELMRVQNPLYFGVSTATAEVASQYLEDFVLDVLKEDADDEQALAIIMSRLNDDISSTFRQVACYRFEQELHKQYREKGYLDNDEIGKIFQKEMESYMGPAVEQSPGSENWWVYWSHIRKFFYVYSYASGLLIAKNLQQNTRKDQEFVKKVKQFLAAGTSASTQDIFADLDIDITDAAFWEDGIKQIESQLDEAENLAKKLGKL